MMCTPATQPVHKRDARHFVFISVPPRPDAKLKSAYGSAHQLVHQSAHQSGRACSRKKPISSARSGGTSVAGICMTRRNAEASAGVAAAFAGAVSASLRLSKISSSVYVCISGMFGKLAWSGPAPTLFALPIVSPRTCTRLCRAWRVASGRAAGATVQPRCNPEKPPLSIKMSCATVGSMQHSFKKAIW